MWTPPRSSCPSSRAPSPMKSSASTGPTARATRAWCSSASTARASRSSSTAPMRSAPSSAFPTTARAPDSSATSPMIIAAIAKIFWYGTMLMQKDKSGKKSQGCGRLPHPTPHARHGPLHEAPVPP